MPAGVFRFYLYFSVCARAAAGSVLRFLRKRAVIQMAAPRNPKRTNAPVRPFRSAMWPRTGVTVPPMLTARPRVTPEAKPMWLGRYCWPEMTIGL